MKLSNYDFVPRTGTHESFMPWREDKVTQLSGNRIKLTAGSSWSAGITMLEPLPLGTLTIEFDCRVMGLDPYACFAIWRYHDKSQDEYDDCEFSFWGDANNWDGMTSTVYSRGEVYTFSLNADADFVARMASHPHGFRRYKVKTTDNVGFYTTSIYGMWWNKRKDETWGWDWKTIANFGLPKPADHNPGVLRIALWVPKRGLLYPASASAPLVATINSMAFEPLSSEVAK